MGSPGGNGGEGSGRERNGMIVNKRLTAASLSNRNTNRYSVTALYSMAAEQDVEVEDDLARGR
jgi:Ras GTPase-activating-like protein IQGAP2/3